MSKRGTEIERRFLLNRFPDINRNVKATSIEQGYFEMPSSSDSFRVRIMGGSSAVLTLKDGRGVSRSEDEERISLRLARKLFDRCHHRINKFRITYRGWEIDIFGGVLAGVILAEKELASIDEKLELPIWLGHAVEVTDSLTNLHLARLASDLEGTDSSAIIHLERKLRKVHKAVITGGPCSGKSTIIELLKKDYPEIHFVPEVATIIISQLGILPGSNSVSATRFQQAIYRTQKLFEDTSVEFATDTGKKGVVFDRGTLDGAAYMAGGVREFEKSLKTRVTDEYGRYNRVILIAVPPKEIYEKNRTNNPARKESFEEAQALGNRVGEVWSSHPGFYTSLSELWDEKVNKAKRILEHGWGYIALA